VTALVASGLLGPESFLGVFLIFCRVGACLLIVPGPARHDASEPGDPHA
jgi:flagellar biosynthetic protein FliR